MHVNDSRMKRKCTIAHQLKECHVRAVAFVESGEENSKTVKASKIKETLSSFYSLSENLEVKGEH